MLSVRSAFVASRLDSDFPDEVSPLHKNRVVSDQNGSGDVVMIEAAAKHSMGG